MSYAPDQYFQREFGVDDVIIRKVLAAALETGGEFADLFFEHSTGMSVALEDDVVNRASTSASLGVGIRVVVGDQTGYAFTEELTAEAMVAAARTAAGIANRGDKPGPVGISHRNHPVHYNTSPQWSDVGVAEIMPMLTRLNEEAYSRDGDVAKVKVHFAGGESNILVVDSEGRFSADRKPMTSMYLSVVMDRDGERQSNSRNLAAREGLSFYTDERLDRMVDQCIDWTKILFEAKRPPGGDMPVVLAAGSSGILLHEAIGHGLEADFNRKGISVFSERVGTSVANEHVTIVDSGVEPNLRGSINFDDEGNPAQTTTLVEDGVLRGYLHDRVSAKHYGVEPTGSGRRQSFRHSPLPRMRNTYMLPGPHDKEEIIASVKKGIYAISFTNGQVNIGPGDYAFYVKNGYLIEDGKLTAPIKDINIIGNGPDSLSKIDMVGNDFAMDEGGWTCGKDGQSVPVSLGLPTVLVSSVAVGGSN